MQGELDEAGAVFPGALGRRSLGPADLGPPLVTGHWLWPGDTDSFPPFPWAALSAAPPALPLTCHSPRPQWIRASRAAPLALSSALGSFTFVLLLPSKRCLGKRKLARLSN